MASRTVGVRVGNITKTTATAVLCSLTNTTTTFLVNGVTTTINSGDWTAIGTDAGSPTEAGFYKTISISSLTAFTEYSWTVTQGAWSNSGSFRTAANATDDFTLFFASCFNRGSSGVEQPGFLSYIRDYQQNGALPVQAILWLDDLYYVDTLQVSGGGKVSADSPDNILREYEYALAWFAWMGMMDSDQTYPVPTLNDTLENSAFMPQWGDHEFTNDIKPGDAWVSATPYHATNPAVTGYDGVGLTAYQKLIQPLQGTGVSIKSLDTQSNHWAADFGIVRYIAADGITRATGTPLTTGLGNNQIDDILAAMNISTPVFKLLGMYNELRTIGTGTYAVNKTNEILPTSEYQRMFTTTGGTSISTNKYTCGAHGVSIVLKGDNHSGAWSYLQAPASGGQAPETIFVCNSNNARGAISTRVTTEVTSDSPVVDDNAKIYWSNNQIGRCAGIQIDVYGSTGKINVKFIWKDGVSNTPPYTWTTAVSRWFCAQRGNEGVDTEAEAEPVKVSIITPN